MDCRTRVRDVFITSTDQADTTFEDHVGSVWSVEVESLEPPESPSAILANWETAWIMTDTMQNSLDLEVGDIIRIGKPFGGDHTDYITVVEKVAVKRLVGGMTGLALADFPKMSLDSKTTATIPCLRKSRVDAFRVAGNPIPFNEWNGSTTTYLDASGAETTQALAVTTVVTPNLEKDLNTLNFEKIKEGTIDPTEWTTSHTAGGVEALKAQLQGKTVYAYRMNTTHNFTTPPVPTENTWAYAHLNGDLGTASTGDLVMEAALLTDRHTLGFHYTWTAPTNNYCPFPVFKVRQATLLTMELDTSVKRLHWVKLIGYSIYNKRHYGFQNAHETQPDDWFALHCNEIPGAVLSNNSTAAGAFCVLHSGTHSAGSTGAVEVHGHDPQGLAHHVFITAQKVNRLNFKFMDYKNEPVKFGRIHLWFKVCCEHG